MKARLIAKILLGMVVIAASCKNNPTDSGDNSNNQHTTPSQVSTGMVRIPGGTFQMGGTLKDREKPVHTVTVSTFYMDTTEVTQADYQSLMGANPSHFTGDANRPVEMVSWYASVLYCNARSKRDGRDTVYSYSSVSGAPGDSSWHLCSLKTSFSKNGYRLPTEAEWEYACRAGTTTDYYWGRDYAIPSSTADTTAADRYAVWDHNSNSCTQPVAGKLPNAFGLYDMSGNVWEWCNDLKGNYPGESETDPTGPESGVGHICRGGCYGNYLNYIRSANRIDLGACDESNDAVGFDGIGFRCVRR